MISIDYTSEEKLMDFIRFIIYALASNDETIDHLETLFETQSLNDEARYNVLHQKITTLGKKLNSFLQSVENNHNDTFGGQSPL